MAHNVIYFDSSNNQIPLAGIANLPYTDVILAFLAIDAHLMVYGNGGAFDANLQSNIRALQNAGKKVLVSFGGDPKTFTSSAWQLCAKNVAAVANNISGFVTHNGLDGVDIDYEDNTGFTGGPAPPAYDGVGFLCSLTTELAHQLPPGRNIITHAPQTPYWDPAYHTGPYRLIWHTVGSKIAWINNQFYSNSAYDHDAATKVTWYRNIAAITGPQKLLAGALLAGGEGVISLNDMVQNVIGPLQSQFGAQFGGVMGWQFSLDQGGNWGQGIGHALGL